MSELERIYRRRYSELDDKRLEESESGKIDCTRVYLKSEVDKVISKLEERIADGDKDFEMADHQNERLLKIVRHHKYKRCLDKAEMCRARYDEEDAKVNGCGASWDYISEEMKYWERWEKRWLELAEKFKT